MRKSENSDNVDDLAHQNMPIKKYTKLGGFYASIDNIQKWPWLLGSYSLSSLCDCLTGFAQAKLDYGIPLSSEEEHFIEFQEWICKRYSKSNQPWRKIILLYSYDEKTALDEFFQLFNEFKNEVPLGD